MTDFLTASRDESVDGFMVPYGLLGSKLTFPYRNGQVSVALPIAPNGKLDSWPSCAFSEGFAADGDHNPETAWYDIYRLKFSWTFPAPAFLGALEDAEWNSPEFAARPEVEQHLQDSIANLDDAVAFWKAVARCVIDSGMIGRSEVKFGEQVGFRCGAKIVRVRDGRVFRNHGGVTSSHERLKLTADHWRELEKCLCADFQLPLWCEYIYEAERRLAANDVNGAVISAAIACESVVRAVLWSNSPVVPNDTVRRLFDTVSVQAVLNQWESLTGMTKSELKSSGKSEVHSLLNLRNDLLHKAVSMTQRKAEIGILIRSIKKFIRTTDELIRRAIDD